VTATRALLSDSSAAGQARSVACWIRWFAWTIQVCICVLLGVTPLNSAWLTAWRIESASEYSASPGPHAKWMLHAAMRASEGTERVMLCAPHRRLQAVVSQMQEVSRRAAEILIEQATAPSPRQDTARRSSAAAP